MCHKLRTNSKGKSPPEGAGEGVKNPVSRVRQRFSVLHVCDEEGKKERKMLNSRLVPLTKKASPGTERGCARVAKEEKRLLNCKEKK